MTTIDDMERIVDDLFDDDDDDETEDESVDYEPPEGVLVSRKEAARKLRAKRSNKVPWWCRT
jgi:hypothetical protein